VTDDWSEWEVVRRQVAVCGRMSPALVDTVEVRVEGKQAEGKQAVTTASVRHDGIYFCLDLASGDYRVTAADGLGEVFGGGTGHVSRNADGDVTFAVVDIEVPSSPPPSRRLRKKRPAR
jgi:hypothetical protein